MTGARRNQRAPTALGTYFYGLNLILFASTLKYRDASKAYPALSAINFSTLSIAAATIFRVLLSITNYVDLLVIIIGITLVSL